MWLVALLVLLVVLAAVYFLLPGKKPTIDILKFKRKYPDEKAVERPYYDVICVGAGPSGACLGYYLTKMGRKVLLLEKKSFPRDKYCGNAVCKTGIEILHEMGLYKKLVKENKAHVADCGGMCSPGGLTYIGRSKEILGEIPAALACKRIILDEALARRAQEVGVELLEDHPVKDAVLDKNKGLWTVSIENSEETFQGRVLVCADGAPSKLATLLGLVTQPPQGSCSRAYVEPGTHNFHADGVVFYHKEMLPGYSALFRHPNNELNYCVYIIPGNPQVTNETLPYWHEQLTKKDKNISKALGSGAKLERMKAAALRFGGEKKTFADHLLVIGDAAGLIDPMTGEGIHTAMESGKTAASVLNDAFTVGNFDAAVLEEYQNRWLNSFGTDFYWSMKMCQLTYRFPILLDAATAAIMRKGDKFLARWADIMTGRVPKVHLLHPEFVIVITFEIILILFRRLIGLSAGRKNGVSTLLTSSKDK